MNKVTVPAGYKPVLNSYDLQQAIAQIKAMFQEEFTGKLHLKRVSAPLFVASESGLNDNLSGKERPVSFDIPAMGADAQVVQSLAKWKRQALQKYGFGIHEGLCICIQSIFKVSSVTCYYNFAGQRRSSCVCCVVCSIRSLL